MEENKKYISGKDIWIVSSDPKRGDFLKSVIPDEGHDYMVFDRGGDALDKMDYIHFHRDKKPDLIITDEKLKDDQTEEILLSKVIADDAKDKKVPAIILSSNELSSENFAAEFREKVRVELAKNRFSGLKKTQEQSSASR